MSSALLLLGLLVVSAQDDPAPPPERAEDAKAIEALTRSFTTAYNAGDAKAIAALFTDEAEVLDEAGVLVEGRDAIAEVFEATFASDPGATIELTRESLRFLGPDVAREVGRARTVPSAATGGPADLSRFLVIYVRKDGRWLHSTIEEHDDPNLAPHDRLEELAWLVGDWVDESEESLIHTSCRWSDDGSFLVRDFTLRFAGQPFSAGHQRIGWDPRTKGFRSWIFDADGGHSESLWSRGEPGQWIIKAEGVLADGRAVSATQILTFVSNDLARWRSVDRTLGGQAIPDLPEVVLVRKPPEPSAPVPPPTPSRQP